MKEFFKTKSPYEKKEKIYKQEGLLSSEKTSLLNSKIPSFFDTKEKSTQKSPSFLLNDDAEAVEQGKKLARKAIDGNLRRGAIDSAFLQSHPNLYDGLSMFYAHSLSKNKNHKAANEAYKYAYEEAVPSKAGLLLSTSKPAVNGYVNKSFSPDKTDEKSFEFNLTKNSTSKASDQSETDKKWFDKDNFDLSFLDEPYKAVKKVADSHTKIAKDIYDAIRKTVILELSILLLLTGHQSIRFCPGRLYVLARCRSIIALLLKPKSILRFIISSICIWQNKMLPLVIT